MSYILSLLPFFIIGFNSQIFQIILIRETFTAFYGFELAFAVLLSVWLLWTGLGSIFATIFTKFKIKPEYLFFAATFIVSTIIFVEIYFLRMLREFFDTHPGAPLPLSGLIISALIILFPVCFFIGAQFLFASMFSNDPKKVYIVECIGAGIAGLLLSTPLLEFVNHFLILSVCLLLNLSTCFYFFSVRGLFRKYTLYASSIILIGVVFPLIYYSAKIDFHLREKFFNNLLQSKDVKLVECVDSKYGNISVVEYAKDYTIYQSGKRLFSLPDRRRDYASMAMITILQHKNPKNILLIGGGASGLLKEIVNLSPESVDYVELDPKILTVSSKYAGAEDVKVLNDEKIVTKIYTDGRRFINTTQKKYDVIIILTGDPTSALVNRFFTSEFISLVKQKLTSEGVFVLGCLTSYDIGTDELILQRNRCLFFTLRSHFKNVLATPGKSLIFISSDSDYLSLSFEEIINRMLERKIDPYSVDISFVTEKEKVEKINYELKTGLVFDAFGENIATENSSNIEINTDIRPTAFFDSTLIWLRLFDEKLLGTVLKLKDFPYLYLCVPLALLFILLIFAKRRTSKKIGAVLICFSVSATGIALEISCITAYQYSYGYIYSEVGLLFSLFMFGLACGAMFYGKILGGGIYKNTFILLTIMSLVSGLFFISSREVYKFSEATKVIFFFSLMFIIGFLVGGIFPLVMKIWKEETSVSGAGILYGVDIIGGCVGSFILGTIILPLYGSLFLIGSSLALSCFAFFVTLVLFLKRNS